MKKLKIFFQRVVKSLTKFSYYKEIYKANFKFSLKYLFFLLYCISLIGSLIFAISRGVLVIPKVPSFVATFQSKASSLYPDSLIINIKNGILTTNQKEPYYVDSLNTVSPIQEFDHVLTIDTKANPSDIKNFNTLVLVTDTSVVTQEDKNNTYKVYPIDKTTTLTINKSEFNNLVAKVVPYLGYLLPGIIILLLLSFLIWPFIASALWLLSQLFYLLIFTAIFFVVVKIMKKKLTFKKLFQLSMHASTLPVLLGAIVGAFGIHMPFLLGSAILFVFMILVMNEF